MTHQGFIGSLGTSFLLVSSAVAILLIVGAIVAFEGFPGPGVDESTQPFTVRGLGPDQRPEPDLIVAPPAEPDGEAAAEAALAGLDVAAVDASGGQAAPPSPPSPDDPTSTTEVAPIGSPGGGGSGSDGSGEGGLVPTLRDTVLDTTRVLQSTVEELLPPTERVFDLVEPPAG